MTEELENYHKTRLQAFENEWVMRVCMLRQINTPEEEIALYRKEILHMYGLTEEDLK